MSLLVCINPYHRSRKLICLFLHHILSVEFPCFLVKSRDEPLIHIITLKRNTISAGHEEALELLQDTSVHQWNTMSQDLVLSTTSVVSGKLNLHSNTRIDIGRPIRQYFSCALRTSSKCWKSFLSIGNKLGIIDDVNEGRQVSRVLDWLETTGENICALSHQSPERVTDLAKIDGGY